MQKEMIEPNSVNKHIRKPSQKYDLALAKIVNEWCNSGGMLQQQGRETLKSSQGPCAPAGWQASKHSDPLHPTVKTCFHTIIAAQQIFYCLRRKIEPPDFEVGLNLNYSHVYIVVGEVACN